jgi:hypothetical protein
MAEDIIPSPNGHILRDQQIEHLSAVSLDNGLSLSTLAVHADDTLNGLHVTDVAPALHVSTTFRYTNDLSKLNPISDEDVLILKTTTSYYFTSDS